jgi:hypothetical protein
MGFSFQYLEDETIDDLRCAKLRLGALFWDEKEPKHQFFFLRLARAKPPNSKVGEAPLRLGTPKSLQMPVKPTGQI